MKRHGSNRHRRQSETSERLATETDVGCLVEGADSRCVVDILLLQPTYAELEEAALWSRGDAYLLGRQTLGEKGKKIFSIIQRKVIRSKVGATRGG